MKTIIFVLALLLSSQSVHAANSVEFLQERKAAFENAIEPNRQKTDRCIELIDTQSQREDFDGVNVHFRGTPTLVVGKPLMDYTSDELIDMKEEVKNCFMFGYRFGFRKVPRSNQGMIGFYDDYINANFKYNQKKKEEELARLNEEEARLLANLAKEEANKLLDIRDKELRAGTRKPKDFKEAVIASSADDGSYLASAPKIRPDNKSYHLYGILDAAGSKPEFTAELLQLHMRSLFAGEWIATNMYFKVRVPKSMQDRYYDTAKIGAKFNLVGRYTGNINYRTVSGETKSMPVFDAVYLELN